MKRFTAIIIVFGLLISSFSVYANFDSESKLKNWHDRAFETVLKDLAAEYFAGAFQLTLALADEEKDQSAEGIEELEKLSIFMSEYSGKEIGNYQRHYIEVANKTEKDLKKKDLTAIKAEEKQKLEAELDANIDELLAEALQ